MLITKAQLLWMTQQFNLAGLYLIPPLELLDLATRHQAQYDNITHPGNPKSLSREEFESLEVRSDWKEMPRLAVMEWKDGIHVMGHEGRHRAWATHRSGAHLFLIAITSVQPLTRIPEYISGQHRPISYKFRPEYFIPVV